MQKMQQRLIISLNFGIQLFTLRSLFHGELYLTVTGCFIIWLIISANFLSLLIVSKVILLINWFRNFRSSVTPVTGENYRSEFMKFTTSRSFSGESGIWKNTRRQKNVNKNLLNDSSSRLVDVRKSASK